MNPRLPTFLASLLLSLTALGDVIVNFRNNVLTGNVKVTFGWNSFGLPTGSPVVNSGNGFGGKSFVAQLFWRATETDCYPRPVGATVNFRQISQGDPLAGTWSGANRTIVGPPPNAVVSLEVRVWDASFASFEAAAIAGGMHGQSAPFSYQNKLSNPPESADTHMVNFRGFELFQHPVFPGRGLHLAILPDLQLTVPENGSVEFHPGIAATSAEAAVNGAWYPPKGRIAGSGTNLTYFAPTNYYGTDAFELALSGDLSCTQPQRVTVTIQPSPARLTPRLNLGGESGRLVYFWGLINRQYLVQKSTNLQTWTTWQYVQGTKEPRFFGQFPALGEAAYIRLVDYLP